MAITSDICGVCQEPGATYQGAYAMLCQDAEACLSRYDGRCGACGEPGASYENKVSGMMLCEDPFECLGRCIRKAREADLF